MRRYLHGMPHPFWSSFATTRSPYRQRITAADLLLPTLGAMTAAVGPFLDQLMRNAWWVAPSLLLGAVLRAPMPGRGPVSRKRDSWRGFKHGLRREVLDRAQHRCEASAFVAWGRCSDAATEVDHVYPWSRFGPTTASNGQALCSGHNRSKGAWAVPWWYVRALERRRRSYFPAGTDVRVRAWITEEERAAREARPVRASTNGRSAVIR